MSTHAIGVARTGRITRSEQSAGSAPADGSRAVGRAGRAPAGVRGVTVPGYGATALRRYGATALRRYGAQFAERCWHAGRVRISERIEAGRQQHVLARVGAVALEPRMIGPAVQLKALCYDVEVHERPSAA
jgi:hypothetical protein